MNVKKDVAESFERLLKKGSFENITIQNIADECEISRTTFYRNFKDKYDLMNWVYQKELDKFSSSLIDKKGNYEATKFLSDFIYSKKNFFAALFKVEGQNSFTEFLAEYSIKFTKDQLKYVFDETIPEEVMDSAAIYCYGGANYLKRWAIGGFKKTPEEITVTLCNNVPENLAKCLYR